MISIEFLLTSFVVIVTPGPGMLFSVSTGLSQGRAASVYAALGCALGIVPHMLVAGLVLAATLQAGDFAFQVLKVFGVLYLLYLAVMTWRDRTAFAINENALQLNAPRLIVKAVLLNMLNPKLTLFFLAFLPQFTNVSAAQPMLTFGVLSGIFMVMSFAVFTSYGLLAHGFRQLVVGSPAIQAGLRRGFAVAFVLMAAKLAMP